MERTVRCDGRNLKRHGAHAVVKNPFRAVLKIAGAALGVGVLGILYLVRSFWVIKIGRFDSRRLGHMLSAAEVWLRSRALEGKGSHVIPVFITGKRHANQAAFAMISTRMRIISSDLWDEIVRTLAYYFPFGPWIDVERKVIRERPEMVRIWNAVGPQLKITKGQEEEGRRLLKSMGMEEGEPYVCFCSRDSAYLDSIAQKDWTYHSYRDTDVKDFMLALDYITSQGIKVLRMGAVVKERLKTDNPRIIDYATQYRTEVGDIYLMKNCKFYLADSSGAFILPAIFDRPLALVNIVPMSNLPRHAQDIFMLQTFWDKSKQKFLTFKEMIESGADHWARTHLFEESGIQLVKNTPEEILSIAREMNEKIDRKWLACAGDEALQQKYWSLFPKNHRAYGTKARIGAEFLRNHKNLLEQPLPEDKKSCHPHQSLAETGPL